MTLLKTVQSVELAHQSMQNKQPKIFIIAGEVSGDVLGGRIMSQMPQCEFVGIGGENMTANGLKSIFPMSDLSVMGVIEVLFHARTLTRRIRETVNAIIDTKPDLVLTIDSPGFAKGVIKQLRKSESGSELVKNGLKFHHIVAPQVWAWRSGRAKKYAKTFDKLYAFFDFEVPYFTAHGLDTVAVGHPISDGLVGRKTKPTTEKIITLVPGSRISEVKKLLPIFRQVAQRLISDEYSGYKFVIPAVETTIDYVRKHTAKWGIPIELISSSNRYDIYAKTYIAIVASGTVSAELAMLHIPTIVVYKMNAITTWIGHQLIKVRWVSLVNILLNHGVYPEFLGTDATADNVLNAVQHLTIPSVRSKMIAELSAADTMWQRSNGAPTKLIAESILQSIPQK